MTKKEHNFVFTLTAGRTGTSYLAELLGNNLPDVQSHHEILGYTTIGVDTPDLSDFTVFNSKGNTPKIKSFWEQKLNKIAKTKEAYYVETSHLLMKAGLVENLDFLKGYGIVHLIALKRDWLKTMTSYWRRGDFRNIGNIWLWFLDPNYPANIVPWKPFEKFGIYGKYIWYLCEIEARAQYYKLKVERKKWIKIHEVDLDKLNKKEGVQNLLTNLGVTRQARLSIPKPQNVSDAKLKLPKELKEHFRQLIQSVQFDPKAAAQNHIKKQSKKNG